MRTKNDIFFKKESYLFVLNVLSVVWSYIESHIKQEFTDEESKRQYMKERQKKDNHNLSK